MFGYFGIGVIVVFRVMFVFIVINCFSNACADVFSQKHTYSNIKTIQAGKILIFINPNCRWCQKALSNIDVFKQDYPQWTVQVYVMASIKEFIDFVHTELPGLPVGLDYTLDMKNMIANSYGVRKTPTYIILNEGQLKKVEGYVDINRSSFMAQF